MTPVSYKLKHQSLRILQQQFFDGSESECVSCEVALRYAEPSASLSPGSPEQAVLSKVMKGSYSSEQSHSLCDCSSSLAVA